jgi:putative DNA primase/helicase
MERGMNAPVPSIDVEAEITALAKLPRVEYERQRKGAAQKLALSLGLLDEQVHARRKAEQPSGQGQLIKLTEHEPWHEPVDGAQLLDAMAELILRHVMMSRDEANTVALWVLASYAVGVFFIFPRLLLKSPEKGCGKSTLVDQIGRLVNRPLVASHTTASPLFRLIEKVQPTILLDEADVYLRNNEEARAIINAGHKKGAMVMRSVGDEHEPRAFSVFAPMVIAGIGKQAETVEDRSIIIELKRKKTNERTESFRADRADKACLLARQCARWTADNILSLGAADPVMPDAVYNRAADNWRPLLAVADAIGASWPEQARAIAMSMTKGELADNVSLQVQVLRDIRAAFAPKGGAPVGSNELVSALRRMPDRPWNEYGRGRGFQRIRWRAC